MLLDPTEPEHLILFRHFDKISQTFLEFFGAFSCPVNERDSNVGQIPKRDYM